MVLPIVVSIFAILVALLMTVPIIKSEPKDIPLAVISLDQGIKTPTGEVNAGSQLVEKLTDSTADSGSDPTTDATTDPATGQATDPAPADTGTPDSSGRALDPCLVGSWRSVEYREAVRGLGEITMLDLRQYRDAHLGTSLLGILGLEVMTSDLQASGRSILGATQRQWLFDTLDAAQSDGVRWKLAGSNEAPREKKPHNGGARMPCCS